MPKYSKQTYEMVAEILKEVRVLPGGFTIDIRGATIEAIAARFVVEFLHDNPRFDPDKFLAATGRIME